MLMARSAGVDGLAVTYGAHDPDALRSAGPVAMVDSVAQMQAWLGDRVRAPFAGAA